MELFSVVTVVDFSFAFQQVDNALECGFSANRELHCNSLSVKSVVNGLNCVKEICAYGIHLVNKCDTRYMVMICLSPNGFRLGLNAVLSTEYCYGTIKYAERTFNFYSEVYVPWSINDVYSVSFPMAGGSCGSNGNPAFLFLFHPVHGSCAIMNFTNLMIYTGVVKNTFRGSCLAGIDVCHDTDITGFYKRKFSSHDFSPSFNYQR